MNEAGYLMGRHLSKCSATYCQPRLRQIYGKTNVWFKVRSIGTAIKVTCHGVRLVKWRRFILTELNLGTNFDKVIFKLILVHTHSFLYLKRTWKNVYKQFRTEYSTSLPVTLLKQLPVSHFLALSFALLSLSQFSFKQLTIRYTDFSVHTAC